MPTDVTLRSIQSADIGTTRPTDRSSYVFSLLNRLRLGGLLRASGAIATGVIAAPNQGKVVGYVNPRLWAHGATTHATGVAHRDRSRIEALTLHPISRPAHKNALLDLRSAKAVEKVICLCQDHAPHFGTTHKGIKNCRAGFLLSYIVDCDLNPEG